MAQVPLRDRLSSPFPFLNKKNKEDVRIYETYMKYKELNGNKSHPHTIRDMISAIGEFMGLYEKRLLLSVQHTDNGYEVKKIIDTTIISKDKGD